MKYNASELVEASKSNALIPTSQNRFSNSDILRFLNEELQTFIVTELLALRQDYFVTTHDISLVANQSSYSVPSFAIGWKVESVGYVDTAGTYSKLNKLNREQRGEYSGLTDATTPSAFYLMGNSIVTVPDMGSSPTGSIRLDLVRLQNELVLPNACGEISAVTDTGTDYQMTVGTVPISDGDTCDVVSGTNPFDIIARGVTSSVSGYVVTVTYGSDFSRAPVAGDYVCVAGTTPYANIPEDFHPLLALRGTMRCLRAMNDIKGLQSIAGAYSDMLDTLRARGRNRVNDAPTKVKGNDYLLNLGRWS